jgi:hypothetical protein
LFYGSLDKLDFTKVSYSILYDERIVILQIKLNTRAQRGALGK